MWRFIFQIVYVHLLDYSNEEWIEIRDEFASDHDYVLMGETRIILEKDLNRLLVFLSVSYSL
jgi:hypothetical protein